MVSLPGDPHRCGDGEEDKGSGQEHEEDEEAGGKSVVEERALRERLNVCNVLLYREWKYTFVVENKKILVSTLVQDSRFFF